MEDWESDSIVDRWIIENNDSNMPLPDIELNPHVLISKVRKHYMEYLIKLLSINYENNQKQVTNKIYLPSAIWRCAKKIEMSAAQACMVVQLYRKSITNVVKDLKTNTKKGLLYAKLYECLHYAPENEKKTQTTLSKSSDCNCKCSCNRRKKFRRVESTVTGNDKNNIVNNRDSISIDAVPIQSQRQHEVIRIDCDESPPKLNENATTEMQSSDDLMQQLERLFQGDTNDEDSVLFDGALFETDNSTIIQDKKVIPTKSQIENDVKEVIPVKQEPHGLNERQELLSSAVMKMEPNQDSDQTKKYRASKWLCEEYFQKVKFFDLLDQIGDADRKKLTMVKEIINELFGDDSDDDGIISPLEESTFFAASCKERVAPWLVEILTPYYVKGRIIGKKLFKNLVKHLINLIYQCSKYPSEYEVQSFVTDFLKTHKMIRCEADYKEFKIENFEKLYE